MLERIHYLAKKGVDFAFETTLASRTFAPWINDLRKTGYDFHLVFLWLPNEDFAIARVLTAAAFHTRRLPSFLKNLRSRPPAMNARPADRAHYPRSLRPSS